MPTPKSKTRSFVEAMSAVVPAASIGGFPRPEPAQVYPSLPALAEAENALAILRKDHARNIAEQLRVEQEGRSASAELIGSRVILERKIAAAERGLHELHREQANENYAADADGWADLQRSRALCVLALRRINREIDKRKASYRSGGVDAELPVGDDVLAYLLLGLDVKRPGRTGLPIPDYLRRCVSAKFITALEASEDE